MYRVSAPGSRPGLERIEALLKVLDHPQRNLKAVHIAGTNGKGSTSLMIADIISIAGYRVGRFISPHLHSYKERFLIDGQEIRPEILKEYLDIVETAIKLLDQNEKPTEFEILTAIAFLYFRDNKVDLAVMEVGMGGLYDSTNVIQPIVAVITSIGYDHTAFLGNTIKEIAENKAGIIKPGIKVVMGNLSMEAQQVVRQKAALENAEVIAAAVVKIEKTKPSSLSGQYINLLSRYFKVYNAQFSLLGDFQLNNLAAAICTVEALTDNHFIVKEEHVQKALKGFKMPGRLEILQWQPLVIGDVAHNPQGAQALASSLKSLLPDQKRILLCGFLDDKDIASNLEALGEESKKAIISRPKSDRANHWQGTAEIWKQLYPDKEIWEIEDITEAVQKGLSLLKEKEYLLITGSFYLLDEARRFFY